MLFNTTLQSSDSRRRLGQRARRGPRASVGLFASASLLFQIGAVQAAPTPLGRFEKKPVEYLTKVAVKGDGRCLFRSLALGLAASRGVFLTPSAEEEEADLLRLAVADAICPSEQRRKQFPDALISIKSEFTLKDYCKRIIAPTFWGGEAELLVLTALLKQPVTVYLAPGNALGYRALVTYGEKYELKKNGSKRRPIKLLYSNGNHYELLLDP